MECLARGLRGLDEGDLAGVSPRHDKGGEDVRPWPSPFLRAALGASLCLVMAEDGRACVDKLGRHCVGGALTVAMSQGLPCRNKFRMGVRPLVQSARSKERGKPNERSGEERKLCEIESRVATSCLVFLLMLGQEH